MTVNASTTARRLRLLFAPCACLWSCLCSSAISYLLFYAKNLDFKDKRSVGRDNSAGASGSITEVGRNDQLAFPSDLHGQHTLVPALYHPSHPYLERERLASLV